MESIICALSGLTPTEEEMALMGPEDEVPHGWTKLTITTAQANPKRITLERAQRLAVQQSLSQLPPDLSRADREDAEAILGITAEAQFAYLLDQTPHMVAEEQTLYLAPVSRCPEVNPALRAAMVALGAAVVG